MECAVVVCANVRVFTALDLPAKDSQGRSSPTNTWAKLLLLSAEDAIRNAESYAALAVGELGLYSMIFIILWKDLPD